MNEKTNTAGVTLPPVALCCLVIALVLGFAMHAPRLPIGVNVLFFIFIVLLGFERYRARTTPVRQWRHRLIGYALLFCATATVYGSYGYLLGRGPMMALFPLLVVLKFREMQGSRDYQLLVMMGLFMLASNFIHTQELYTAILSLPIIVLLIAAPLLLHGDLEAPQLPRALSFSMRTLVVAVPFMVLGFVLFPRLSGPLWGIARDPSTALSGLSSSMTPGSISNLSLSDEVVFRAEFHGDVPGQEVLYWRGPVFWQLSGETWSAGRFHQSAREPAIKIDSQPLFYTVTLEPSPHKRMFAIDVPAQAVAGARLSADLQLLTSKPVLERTRYQLASYTQYRLTSSGEDELQRALQLPPDRNPRTIALAQSWRKEGLQPRDIIQRALSMFHDEGFKYTLQPERTPFDSVDFLLFESRKGFCEHYASAFAVLARAAGIPARVVTGYQGGTLNRIGGYYTIRQRDAHAWVEVWQQDLGWMRVDPTLAVAPSRIHQGLQGLLAEDQATASLPLLSRDGELRTMWNVALDSLDALYNNWNQWVIGYDQKQQLRLLSELGVGQTTLGILAVLLGVLVLALFLVYLVMVLRWREPSKDQTVRAYQRFTAKLARIGLARAAHQGPLDFAARAAAFTGQGRDIHAITRLYVRLRYGDGRGDPARLGKMVRHFRPRPRGPGIIPAD